MAYDVLPIGAAPVAVRAVDWSMLVSGPVVGVEPGSVAGGVGVVVGGAGVVVGGAGVVVGGAGVVVGGAGVVVGGAGWFGSLTARAAAVRSSNRTGTAVDALET